jgi:hypothetical protein
MGTPGAKLVASDISCDSLFARLPLKNPLEPTIEWEKHQTPEKWAALLEDAGFRDPWIRWNSLNTLRRPGRIVLGNRVGLASGQRVLPDDDAVACPHHQCGARGRAVRSAA